MRRLATLCFLLAAVAACAEEPPAPREVPAALTTAGGSHLFGMLANDRPLVLRSDKGPRKLAFNQIKSISLGERPDPNAENEARVALGDLQSEQYDVREKALAKLRGLGRAAARALKEAASSPDAEVAGRARALLGEMGVPSAAGALSCDTVVLADGAALQGTIQPGELVFRSRWGRFKFPLPCVQAIEVLLPDEVNAGALAKADQALVSVQPKVVLPLVAGVEEIRGPFLEPGRPLDARQLAGLTVLTMDQKPNPNAKQAPGKRTVEVKVGDGLEDAYAAWGVLLRPEEAGSAVRASDSPIWGKGQAAHVADSDCELSFILPGSYNQKLGTGRPAGVHVVGAVVEDTPPGSVGMAVYDCAGRQLAVVAPRQDNTLDPNAPPVPGVFTGVRSKTPIARVRFFRAGKKGDIKFTGVIYDRIVSVERPAGCAAVWLASGERVAGQLTAAAVDKGLALRPEFLDAAAEPVRIAWLQIERFEPAHEERPAVKEADEDSKEKRVTLGTPHGVLLQSGESFRARLLKLDEQNVLFLLPGRVELKLPRKVLRKIDLAPPAPEPGDAPPPVAVAEDEKPGVDFRRKDEAKPDGPAQQKKDAPPQKKDAPPPPEEKPKKKDVLQTTQQLQRMDNVEILEADMLEGDLKIKDEGGEWTIGLAPVRTLVFPKDPQPQVGQAARRDWVLILREGSRFEVSLKELTPESLSADMAGGTVTLPLQVIEAVERKKKK